MAFMMIDTQPNITGTLVSIPEPVPAATLDPPPNISQIGVLPHATGSQPPSEDLTGWYSLLRVGAEVPVFCWVTLIHQPLTPTDAVNKQYVDGAVAIGIPPTDPLVLNIAVVINSSLTVNGPVNVTGPLAMPNLPLSNAGLAPGTLWNNGGMVAVA